MIDTRVADWLHAGKGQGKVRLPAVWLQVEVPKTSGGSNGMEAALERINAAVAGGATGVVLSANGSGDSDLYNAARSIKVTDGIQIIHTQELNAFLNDIYTAHCLLLLYFGTTFPIVAS